MNTNGADIIRNSSGAVQSAGGFETLRVTKNVAGLSVVFDRPERENSINELFLRELDQAMDLAEADADCRMVVLEGQGGVFCTGMDFSEAAREGAREQTQRSAERYMHVIGRLARSPKVVVSLVDGRSMAGGVGIAAASDLVVATERAAFGLTEILWGLLPACVAPYLIRRVGFQTAYRMTLTTETLSAQQALRAGLVDEISQNPADTIRKWYLKLRRPDETAIADMKRYFAKMWMIDSRMEREAISETTRLAGDPRVRRNIKNFIHHGKFPWETDR